MTTSIRDLLGPKSFAQEGIGNKVLKKYYTNDSSIISIEAYSIPSDNCPNLKDAFLESVPRVYQAVSQWTKVPMVPIRFIYIDCHDKKQLRNPLTFKSINSGYTLFEGSDPTLIVVFRHEDRRKVLIHEIIHCLKYDRLFNQGPIINYLAQYNTGIDPTLPSEAFAETLAIILDVYFNKNDQLEHMTQSINHSIVLCVKLIRLFGPPRIAVLNSSELKKIKFRTETQVFQYVIVRTALLLLPGIVSVLRSPKLFPQAVIRALENPDFYEAINERLMTPIDNAFPMSI